MSSKGQGRDSLNGPDSGYGFSNLTVARTWSGVAGVTPSDITWRWKGHVSGRSVVPYPSYDPQKYQMYSTIAAGL